MKVLFLTYDFPYPLNAGGKIRAYYLIKSLSRENEITLFSYYRDEGQKQYFSELEKYCSKIRLFKKRKAWAWQNILRGSLTLLPFASAAYHSSLVRSALKEELEREDYDLVHFESYYPALYLPLVKKLGVKTLMGNENIEYQIYERYVHSRKNCLLRWLLPLEVFKMRFYEERLWRLADINIAPSWQDAKVIKKKTEKDCPVIPNGVDGSKIRKHRYLSKAKTLIFVGTLVYQANNDAVKYFLERIYPLIKEELPGVKFNLVSWHRPPWLEEYLKDPSVRLIQDKETRGSSFFSQADVAVVPVRVASGTNIKLLEAMASGVPVVATSFGIEGIEAKNGQGVLVADNPQRFASRVVELLKDPKKRRRVGQAGQALVASRYNWSKVGQKLNRIYQELANV